MEDVLVESRLYEYFCYDALFGEFRDKRRLFDISGEIFFDDFDDDELFKQTEQGVVKDVCSVSDYNRVKRLKQFNDISGREQVFSGREYEILKIKGEALNMMTEYGLVLRDATETAVLKKLMGAAEKGNVLALRIFGVLQCEGFIVEKDRSRARKKLIKAARWGDVFSILAALMYFDSDRPQLIKMLAAAVRRTPYEKALQKAEKKYGVVADGVSEEIKLIRQVFKTEKAKSDCYDPMLSRVVYSDVIGLRDKRRVVSSENRDELSSACDLPLGLKTTSLQSVYVGSDEGQRVFGKRKDFKQITDILLDGDLRNDDGYKPLCVCSESDSLLSIYTTKLMGVFGDSHVEKIDVASLSDYQFEPSENNVFVRSVDEDKTNVFLLVFKGEIKEYVFDFVKRFLNTADRKSFPLNHPSVNIDLSAVLPVCICDDENAKSLQDCTAQVRLEPFKEEEKPEIIRFMLDDKAKSHRICGLSLQDDAVENLCSFGLDKIEKIIDRAIRTDGREGGMTLTAKMLEKHMKDCEKEKHVGFGFGGELI